ncbi:WD40-repeat-containing domain protein [Butyriboletus roseoflavus]|nr:WD40-repeat-containing domain protein [Butyriboletus roseoflavus]
MQTGTRVYSISVSRDGKWIVCGTNEGASMWDGEMREKVIDVESGNSVWAMDVSPDSTRFATGALEAVTVWSIKTGERLVGPLEHDHTVTGVKFSPSGEHIATACYGRPIHIFDSHNGDKLITIDTTIPEFAATTPLAWSSDGQQIFATSKDNKINCFDVSTGSQLTESLQITGGNYSLALAPNGKFIATFGDHSIVFLDTLTLSRTGPVIEKSEQIRSIAISQDSSYLATGRYDGKIVVRHLNGVLADNPFVATHEEDERPSVPSGYDSKKDPGKSSHLESDDDGDLLDAEVPSSTPAPQSFDYDEVGGYFILLLLLC